MAISYVANKLLLFEARTSMEVEKPTGHTAGDFIEVSIYVEVNGKKISVTSTGSTVVEREQLQQGTVFRAGHFYLFDDGSSNKIKVTWEGSESKGSVVVVDCYRGVDKTSPINASSAMANTTIKTLVEPSITTTVPNCWHVIHETNASGTELAKTPTGWTLRENYSPYTITRLRESAGATGTTECELTAEKNQLHWSFALKPQVAPELVTQLASAFNNNTSPKETENFTVKPGDILVAGAIGENTNGGCSLGLSGGTVTWVEQRVVNEAVSSNFAYLRLLTAVVTTEETFKVKVTRTMSSGETPQFGVAVQQWRKGTLGESAVAHAEGEPSLSITTKAASSAIAMFSGDWEAKTGAATYRTGAGTFTEKNHVESAGRYTIYGGYYSEASIAQAYTVGMTAPTGQKYSIAALEIKVEGTAGKALPPVYTKAARRWW